MADAITAELNARPLLEAFDRLPEAVAAATKAASKVSADNIQREARRRVRRKTGATADAILVNEMHNKSGYVVQATNRRFRDMKNPAIAADVAAGRLPTMQLSALNIPLWLEGGTRHMDPKPFFYDAAKLEVNAHERRIDEAVGRAIVATGLGD